MGDGAGVKIPVLPVVVFLAAMCHGAEIPAEPLLEKGVLFFSDDFERADLGEWKVVVPTFSVKDGVLRAVQTRDDHGAVGRVHRGMRDVVVEFKFRLEGSSGFSAVFDDKGFKRSHAGHICRAVFAPKVVRLGDDREGVMRNDIFAMRKDPARKGEYDRLMAGRGSVSPAVTEQGRWHHARIEVAGEQMRVVLDGKAVGWLRSPGIGHETKGSFHFTVSGKGVAFDEVRIWKGR